MGDSYRCGKCGGYEFKVDTSPPPNGDARLAVLVICRECLYGVEAASVAEAFSEISKPKEKKETSK